MHCNWLTCLQWMVAVTVVFCSFLCVRGQTERVSCNFNNTEPETSGGSASGDETFNNNPLPQCVQLTDDNLETKVYDVCRPFLRERCFLHDYLDYERARDELSFLNAALLGSSDIHINTECRDVIRAFVCNYYYVGCNSRTRLAQGICAGSCADYVETGDCAPSFAWLANFALATGSSFVFTPECDNPLWYVKVHDPSLENITLDQEGCINMSEVVENPVIAVTTKSRDGSEPTKSPGDNNTGALFGASFAVGAVVFLIAGALLFTLLVYIRRVKKQKQTIRRNLIESMSADRRCSLNNYGINDRLRHPRESVTSSEYYDPVGKFKLTPEDISLLSQELKNALIPFNQVKITGDLGEGAFGCVYKGILTEKGGEEIGVAIKTIKNNSAYHELKSFLEESSIMCTFSHPNVLGMEGICLDEESQSPYLILPFMSNGDLKTFLRKKRGVNNMVDLTYPDELSHDTLLSMCYQIACGMEYLASRKLVHRDLAARNCMMDRDHTVKVADFGLTRDIYQKDYYRQSSRGQVPVKWMAPESLLDHISSEKSDMWSYGVTCWEVFSLGRVPYPTITNSEVVDYLVNGRRLQKPALCSDRFYDIILLCWKDDPDNRPTFKGMMEMLQTLLIHSRTESCGDYYSPGARAKGSYVDVSDFSSSDNYTTSDDSTVFANGSMSFGYDNNSARYTEVPHSRNRSFCHEHFESSKHTPQMPSPLLRSVSYEFPHSIPRESFLQNDLSASSVVSAYLEMAPATPIRLTTLQEGDSPDSS